MAAPLIGIAGLFVVQIAAFAFSYGQIWQQNKSTDRRLNRIEKKLGINGES